MAAEQSSNLKSPRSAVLVLVAGVILGLVIYQGFLLVSGQTRVPREQLEMQQEELEMLRQENQELTDELLRSPRAGGIRFDPNSMPYDAEADAGAMVSSAKSAAVTESKFLMVTFGANWCLDCRTLHHLLSNEPVATYVNDYFLFVNVDVGKFNRNRDVAESLGVSLTRGIPVAVFFNPDGELVGTTNDGQLEPARHYSSAQILKFVRDVVERQRIQPPDSVD